jgi:acyl carrier protein
MDDKLRVVFRDIFGVRPEDFSDDLSVDNVESWDSIKHLTLVLCLEEAFNIQFPAEASGRLTNVRAIKSMLSAPCAAATQTVV